MQVRICWVPRSQWDSTCTEFGVAPINRAFYSRPSAVVYAQVDVGRSVLWHEMGHVLDLPDNEHPQLPPNATLKEMLRLVPAYWRHAKKVGFDSRAGSGLFRWRGPRHKQDLLLDDLMSSPVDIDLWKQMNAD